MSTNNPFHEGELSVQRRTNEAAIAQRNAPLISDALPKAAFPFIAHQPLVVFGSVDLQGNPWASVLIGTPGFISAQNIHTVFLDTQQQHSSKDDPFLANIKNGTEVGLLVIELASRRRLRINGRIEHHENTLYKLTVNQAYPNCSKHIQQRQLSIRPTTTLLEQARTSKGISLGHKQKEIIANADTFFVASANPGHGVDVSHRGGNPGFIQILNQHCIRIPDYKGNSFFNTLGNLTSYPRAGLVFIDFESNRILQFTGEVKILWDQDDSSNQTNGTCRFWELEIKQWIESQLPYELTWKLINNSPYNPAVQQYTSNG